MLAYYAIRAGEVAATTVPDRLRKRLPKYPIPVLHLARLAVDVRVAGKRLGERMLTDALSRALSLSDELGLHAVEIWALNERARAFYEHFGFVGLKDDENHLYLPISTIREAFR